MVDTTVAKYRYAYAMTFDQACALTDAEVLHCLHMTATHWDTLNKDMTFDDHVVDMMHTDAMDKTN